MKVSRLAEGLTGSEILKIAQEINEKKKQGAQISNLTIGDFDSNIFPIPEVLKKEIVKEYANNQTNYPPADGVLSLREVVSEFLSKELQYPIAVDEVVISGGSRPLIHSTYLALVDPGDKVIFTAPSWNNNHYCYLTLANGVMLETKPENDFMPTAEEIKPHLEGATLLALCSPQNPTGTMFSKTQLEEICDAVLAENKSRKADEKPLYILYDQIYWMLTYGKQHYNPVSLRPELKDYVVYVDGSSKCFAATGVRVGWGFGPRNIIDKMKGIIGHMGAWAPKPEQLAMANFLKQENEVTAFMKSMKSKAQASLTALYEGIQSLKAEGFLVDAIAPAGAIYLTVKIDYLGKTTPQGKVLKTGSDLNFYLIDEAKFALVPFSSFGNSDQSCWFRASIGASSLEDIKGIAPRLKEALGKLK